MSRPKKTDDNNLINLVDQYFSLIACGDPAKLKFTLLEEYARSQGSTAKAYDFRRNQAVRDRINELTELVEKENTHWLLTDSAYKNVDIVALLTARRDTGELVRIIEEMDAYWKKVYESAFEMLRENADLKKQLRQKEQLLFKYQNNWDQTQAELDDPRRRCRELEKENRYLRVSIKKYLYPALANEILVEEHALINADTTVTEIAKKDMIEGGLPSSTTEAIATDRKVVNKAERLLNAMWESI